MTKKLLYALAMLMLGAGFVSVPVPASADPVFCHTRDPDEVDWLFDPPECGETMMCKWGDTLAYFPGGQCSGVWKPADCSEWIYMSPRPDSVHCVGEEKPSDPPPQMKHCEVGGDVPADKLCADPVLFRNCSDGSAVMRYATCPDEKKCPDGNIVAKDLLCLSPVSYIDCPDGSQVEEGQSCPAPKLDPPESQPTQCPDGSAAAPGQPCPSTPPGSLFHGCAIPGMPPAPVLMGVPCWPGLIDTGPM